MNEPHLNRSYCSITSDAFKRLSSPTISSARKAGYFRDTRQQSRSNSADKLHEASRIPLRGRYRAASNSSLVNQSNQGLNSTNGHFRSDVSLDQANRSLTNLRNKYEDGERSTERPSRRNQFIFDFNKSYEYKPNYLMKINPYGKRNELTSILKPRSISPTKGNGFNFMQTTEGCLARLDQIKVSSYKVLVKLLDISFC